jgi:uncharacterized protein YjbI with pentapeptide repeats
VNAIAAWRLRRQHEPRTKDRQNPATANQPPDPAGVRAAQSSAQAGHFRARMRGAPVFDKRGDGMIVVIKNRYNDAVLFSCDVADSVDSGLRLRVALEEATASCAYLSGANLSGANLGGAYLSGANLGGANLGNVNLSGANLSGANLGNVNLSGANLGGANLSDANLGGANLSGANLSGANLSDAYLIDANFSGAYLGGAKGAETAIAMTRILPEGTLIGWKKLRDGVIAKLMIPEYAKRSHAFGRKCRAEFAEVLELHGAEVGYSKHDSTFVYRVGDVVKPHKWSEDWQDECAGGIHFFITRLEAENYV